MSMTIKITRTNEMFLDSWKHKGNGKEYGFAMMETTSKTWEGWESSTHFDLDGRCSGSMASYFRDEFKKYVFPED